MSRRLQTSPRTDRKYELDGNEYNIDEFDMTPRDVIFKDISNKKVLETILEEETVQEEVKANEYEDLTDEEEYALREKYLMKRELIIDRYKLSKDSLPDYTSSKFTVKQMIEKHNSLVNSFSTINKIKNYKAAFMGLLSVSEKVSILKGYTFVDGITEIQDAIMDNYDEIILDLTKGGLSSIFVMNETTYSLIVTLLINIVCVAFILLISKILPRDVSINIVRKIIDCITPKSMNKVSEDGSGIVEDKSDKITSVFDGLGTVINGVTSFSNLISPQQAQKNQAVFRP